MITNNPTPSDGDAEAVCVATDLHHRYGDHAALRGVDVTARAGEILALLGPNGSGKTTLFRLLCTLLPIQHGRVEIAGIDSAANPLGVRGQIGIVFQSPSLDNKLTVDENIACQGALYGITGSELQQRRDRWLERLGLIDRRTARCESLSGGLKRRVELAKGMLHRPRLLLLDEPSTGLDPGARLNLWSDLRAMADDGMAIMLTTHLLEEAEKADRVAILSEGEKIAEAAPEALRADLGTGVVTIVATDPERAEAVLRSELGLEPQRLQHQLRLQSDEAASLVPVLAERLGDLVQSIAIGRPSLEDVFIAKTGHRFR